MTNKLLWQAQQICSNNCQGEEDDVFGQTSSPLQRNFNGTRLSNNSQASLIRYFQSIGAADLIFFNGKRLPNKILFVLILLTLIKRGSWMLLEEGGWFSSHLLDH